MKKRILIPSLGLAVIALMAAMATPALALPGYGNCVSSCHTLNSAITVNATKGAAVSSTVTRYTITVANTGNTGSIGYAVFNGATEVVSALGTGGTVDLTNGVTYTFVGAGKTSGGSTIKNTLSVTASAPVVPDTTPPTTTSDAVASYLTSATIHLSATDNLGGSGVAHTYYVLDAGAKTEGTTIGTSVLATHTLQFWSVDTSGNVEATKSVQFNVHAPVPDTTAPTTTSDAKAVYSAIATIKLMAVDNAGGSGVAHTYYVLDNGAQTEGTTITTSVVGTHTVQFWSVDTSGNVETTKAADFTVNPAPSSYTFTYKLKTKNKTYKNLKAVLRNIATGQKFTVKVPKNGKITIKNVPAGRYRLSTTGNSKFKFKAVTISFHV